MPSHKVAVATSKLAARQDPGLLDKAQLLANLVQHRFFLLVELLFVLLNQVIALGINGDDQRTKDAHRTCQPR